MAARLIDDVKYIVFDLDDTLYPELDYCKSGFMAISEKVSYLHGLKKELVFGCLWNLFSNGDKRKVFNGMFEEFNIKYNQDDIVSLVKIYRNHFPDINLPEESLFVLNKLKGACKLGLLTDGYMPAQELKVKSLGIENYFDRIVYTELLGRENWKPSSAGFEIIMEEDDFLPSEYIYIADNPLKDFSGPSKLGWRSVWLKRQAGIYHNEIPENSQPAEFEIKKLKDLLDIRNNGN
ncbi:MAG: HAD family hydrolase [Sedimentisphaeraceae bacterium JB056]